jgi:hypothetical protein
MAVTLDEARTLRKAWFDAEVAVSTGQEYQIGNRKLTRADARYIHQQFIRYDQIVSEMEAGRSGGIPVRRFIPRDL